MRSERKGLQAHESTVAGVGTHLDETAQGLAVGGHEELLVCVNNAVALRTPKVVLHVVRCG